MGSSQPATIRAGWNRRCERPSLATLNGGRQQLLDLSGDGQLDLVEFDRPTPGFYERTPECGLGALQSLPLAASGRLAEPEPEIHRSHGRRFCGSADQRGQRVLLARFARRRGLRRGAAGSPGPDEEQGPQLVFADGTESIFLADLSGDGLTDLVRIRNGEVCYWPNLGYGRFGAKVTMDHSPDSTGPIYSTDAASNSPTSTVPEPPTSSTSRAAQSICTSISPATAGGRAAY